MYYDNNNTQILHRFGALEQAQSCVLEVGAGRGTYSLGALNRMSASNHNAKLVLTDASPDMVVELQKQAADKNNHHHNSHRVEARQANAVDLAHFADHSVDTYLANLVLHHTSDTRRALREAFRVVKPNGRLCLTEVDASHSGTMFAIPQQAMKGMDNDGAAAAEPNSPHNHQHAHIHDDPGQQKQTNAPTEKKSGENNEAHNHSHHHHHHAHEEETTPTTDNNNDNNDNPAVHPHNALRHGGAAELCQLVREAGFVHVVAWHFNAIAETADADRFARHWYKHWQAKEQGTDSSLPKNDDETTEKHQRFREEMRRLAQAELDEGRPITFGTVILTAHKPAL